MSVTVYHGDCRDVMAGMEPESVDAVVTDPPYELGFMGREWDASGVAYDVATWEAVLRVLKPGGHVVAFGGTRTWHRMVVAIEDAGFAIRDELVWLYGSGFPKSLDVSKAIDKAARGVPQGGADPTSPHHGKYRTTTTEGQRWTGDKGRGYGAGGSRFLATTATGRTGAPGTSEFPRTEPAAAADSRPNYTPDATATDWEGWGTALKPAHEPICLARKPLAGTVAGNVLAYGTGALNIDGCRIGAGGQLRWAEPRDMGYGGGTNSSGDATTSPVGRWPANVVLDEEAAAMLDEQSGERPGAVSNGSKGTTGSSGIYNVGWGEVSQRPGPADTGGASRFFYVAKAAKHERPVVDGIAHPTVKPVALMRWLVRLVTPPDGIVLDPFAGTGTTAEAAAIEGHNCVLIEADADHLPLIEARLAREVQPVLDLGGAS